VIVEEGQRWWLGLVAVVQLEDCPRCKAGASVYGFGKNTLDFGDFFQ